MGGRKLLAFELYCPYGEDGVAAVMNAVAVADGQVAEILAGVAERLIEFQDGAEQPVLARKPHPLSSRTQAVVVLAMQDAVGVTDAFSDAFHQFLWHVGAGNEGEYIDEDSFLVLHIECIALFDIERVEITYLYNRLLQLRVGFGCLQEQVVWQFGGSYFTELVKSVECHRDIDIVVPRNETLMTYRPQECTSVEPVFDAVFLANAIYHFQNAQLLQLALPQIGSRIIFQTLVAHCMMFFRCKDTKKLKVES